MTHGLLNLAEAMAYLKVTKSDIQKLVKAKKLTAYKIGGAYLRFKKDQLVLLKHEMRNQQEKETSIIGHGVQNFWAFNQTYIIVGCLMSVALVYLLTT